MAFDFYIGIQRYFHSFAFLLHWKVHQADESFFHWNEIASWKNIP